MTELPARVTIRDVARVAGVSVATVSRVLNSSGPVNAGTRALVREIARDLRYVPNGAARSLITNRTSTLGVLLPDLHGEFFSEVIRGIERSAHERGYHLLLSGSHDAPSEIEAAVGAMRGRVDGLVVMSPAVGVAALAASLPAGLPVVLLNADAGGRADGVGGAFDTIDVDNHGGAYAAVRHLLAHGRRRVAIVRGPAGNTDADARHAGWRAALADAGAAHDPAWELAGDFTPPAGHAAAERLVRLAPRPDALFAANDAMAIGALGALRERGVAVPGEVAVVGFDDIPFARYMSPGLTTVAVDIAALGARAIGALVDAVERKDAHERRRITLPATLVVRESCGAAPMRGGGRSRDAPGRPVARR